MVKSFTKSPVPQRIPTKRTRRIKQKKVPNRPKKILKIKSSDISYYLESNINFLLSQEESNIDRLRRIEDFEFRESNAGFGEIYKKEDRELAIIGLEDMINCILENNPDKKMICPDSLDSSVIALLDYYLKKTKNKLNKRELINILYSSLIYINIQKNLKMFETYFLQNFELNMDFLEVIDLNLYPVKVFDYFEMFFLKISQSNKDDKNHQEYANIFKKVFTEFNFYLNYNDNSKIYRPYDKFIYCLLMTKSFLKNNMSLEDQIVEQFIEYYKNKILFDVNSYQKCCDLIKESKYSFDKLLYEKSVNNLCKENLIHVNNLNSI